MATTVPNNPFDAAPPKTSGIVKSAMGGGASNQRLIQTGGTAGASQPPASPTDRPTVTTPASQETGQTERGGARGQNFQKPAPAPSTTPTRSRVPAGQQANLAAPATQAAAPASSGITQTAIPNETAAQFNAETRAVDPATQTVAGQVDSILSKDSPLMQRARTIAAQGMAQRGLVNSSMAQGAGTAAMIDRALPMAQQDASTYNSVASENMAAKNNVGMFNVGEQNKFGIQRNQQNFDSSQADINRKFTTSERLGSQQFTASQTQAQQNFTAAQSALDRAQQAALADKSIAAQQALQVAQQNFTAAQSALDRTQQTSIEAGRQKFTAEQSALDRTQQSTLETARQNFTAAQSSLDRAQQLAISDKTLAANQALQVAQQNFQTAQNELDRQQRTTLQLDQQKFTENQAKLDRQQQLDVQALTVKAQQAQIPANFAANVNNTTMTGVNAIMADGNLNADQKKAAIANVVNYANSQIEWAQKFYGTEIPKISAPT